MSDTVQAGAAPAAPCSIPRDRMQRLAVTLAAKVSATVGQAKALSSVRVLAEAAPSVEQAVEQGRALLADYAKAKKELEMLGRKRRLGAIKDQQATGEGHRILLRLANAAYSWLDVVGGVRDQLTAGYQNAIDHRITSWLELNDAAPESPRVATALRHLAAMARQYGDRFTVEGGTRDRPQVLLKLVLDPFEVLDKEYNIRIRYEKGCVITLDPTKPATTGFSHGGGFLAKFPDQLKTDRPHPHIYHNPEWTCFGDYQMHVATAFSECRFLDMFEFMVQIAMDPKTNTDTHTLTQFPTCECRCHKCEKWARVGDSRNANPDVEQHRAKKWVCKDCLPKCPDTGKILDPGRTVCIDGVEYHPTAVFSYAGRNHRKKLGVVLDAASGTQLPAAVAKRCVLSGQLGLAQALPKSRIVSGYQFRHALKLWDVNGTVVCEAFLDLVNPDGTLRPEATTLTEGDTDGTEEVKAPARDGAQPADRPGWFLARVNPHWAGLIPDYDGQPGEYRTPWGRKLWSQFHAK